MRFEHRKQKVASISNFLKRLIRYGLLGLLILVFSILVGVLGYHYFAGLSWIDSFYMSCMILTGMGPTNEMPCVSAKVFSSVYALYSGIAFLTMTAVLLAPFFHRILHILHVETDNN